MALIGVTIGICDRAGVLSPARTAIHDFLSPGRRILQRGADHAATSGTRPPGRQSPAAAASNPDTALRENERQRRQLMIENARLRDELRRAVAEGRVDSLLADETGPSTAGLVGFSAVPARVIGGRGLPDRLRELILDAGAAAGVTHSEIVVDGTGLLLDKGTASSVADGDRVLSGAVVVGRVARAARWVSLVQGVSEAGFSSRIQLVRSTRNGLFFGAEGILQGTAEGDCVVTGISSTEAVSVGDEVVSSEIQGIRGPRLYFGRVARAEFLEGGEWLIRVQPAALLHPPNEVSIVRPQLRLATASPH